PPHAASRLPPMPSAAPPTADRRMNSRRVNRPRPVPTSIHLPALTPRHCDARGALSSPGATVGRQGGGMWPEGFRCAASFTFDFDAEEVWIGEDPSNADKPGVLSQGTYGAKVAVPLILELLATHGLT